jgi:hypothetical protein
MVLATCITTIFTNPWAPKDLYETSGAATAIITLFRQPNTSYPRHRMDRPFGQQRTQPRQRLD